jgi:hypothetical protein
VSLCVFDTPLRLTKQQHSSNKRGKEPLLTKHNLYRNEVTTKRLSESDRQAASSPGESDLVTEGEGAANGND